MVVVCDYLMSGFLEDAPKRSEDDGGIKGPAGKPRSPASCAPGVGSEPYFNNIRMTDFLFFSHHISNKMIFKIIV
jgi:hypothetical protein